MLVKSVMSSGVDEYTYIELSSDGDINAGLYGNPRRDIASRDPPIGNYPVQYSERGNTPQSTRQPSGAHPQTRSYTPQRNNTPQRPQQTPDQSDNNAASGMKFEGPSDSYLPVVSGGGKYVVSGITYDMGSMSQQADFANFEK